MNKNIKITMLILIGLLALTTAVGFIYGKQNKAEAQSIYASYDENLISAVNTAIYISQNALKDANGTETEETNLNYYITNIEEAESPVLKAYIADSMINYINELVSVKYQNYSAGIEGSQKANYDGILERLNSGIKTLDAARNYTNTETAEEQNN